LTLFCIEKVSKSWSFLSVIRTSFLSYSCFFLFIVEVTTLLGGEGVGGGSNNEESKEDKEGRSFFSLCM